MNKIRMGLTRIFKTARTRATIRAVVKESILNPGTTYVVTRSTKARIIQLAKSFIRIIISKIFSEITISK